MPPAPPSDPTTADEAPLVARLPDVRSELDRAADALTDAAGLEAFRVRYLGRKGTISALFDGLKSVPKADRRAVGEGLNALKNHAQARFDEAEARLAGATHSAEASGFDWTLPGRRPWLGSLHPLTQTEAAIKAIFAGLGFTVRTGPEIETDWHNFSALNFPADHPARDMQDTLFITPVGSPDSVLLRTHTSPVQIRTMLTESPPIRVLAPGRVYRNDAPDATHSPIFHQVEGLVISEDATFADLKALLMTFAQQYFSPEVKLRFRPSFFPFTEPSAEVDVWWAAGNRWLEVLGCGMVDPNVLEAAGIDAERFTGYAWGMGIERLTMLKYDIADIRLLYENDVRFLRQF